MFIFTYLTQSSPLDQLSSFISPRHFYDRCHWKLVWKSSVLGVTLVHLFSKWMPQVKNKYVILDNVNVLNM